MICIILAGGKGSRISKEYPDIPKAMVPIQGKPVLEYEIEMLRSYAIDEIIIITGYLHSAIENYFKDGSEYGVKITYYKESSPLGTAGALFNIDIKEDFLLCAGDLLFNFSLNKMIEFHKKHNALATVFSHPSSHPFDSTLIKSDEDGKIIDFFRINKSIDSFNNNCSAGIYMISPKLLELRRNKLQGKKCDIDKDILQKSVDTNRIFSYKSTEYVCDIGTPERRRKAEKHLSIFGLMPKHVQSGNKAIFLDRDGTLNIYKGYITDKKQIELTDKAAQAINIFHSLGYLVILVTNQPVVARGECSIDDLKEINGRVEYLLGKDNSYLDDIFFCPHHPHKGFENENKEFKIDCSCRKPKPGLIFKAAEKYDINLLHSYMVGDSAVDVDCAKSAGCTPVFVAGNSENAEDVLNVKSLYDFAVLLLNNQQSANEDLI